jgi:hypothetical protein
LAGLTGLLLLAPACGEDGGGSSPSEDAGDTANWGGADDGGNGGGDTDAAAPDGSADGGGETADSDDGVDSSAPDGEGGVADYATLSIWVDDRANKTFNNGDIRWTGSFSWDEDSNFIVFSSNWLPDQGPYPPLWDDGPISAGGHEAAGQVAGDNIFSTEVYFRADATTQFEYGLLNEFDNWMWVGPNGTVEVPAGSTSRFDLEGLVLPAFGDVDVRITLDVAGLHPDFSSPAPAKVFVKGTLNMWAPVQILDDGQAGDVTAGDGIYTYVHSTKLGPHDGLLNPGQEAQFVFVFSYDPEGSASDGVEYKVGGNAAPEGVKAYTDYESPGEWTEVEVKLVPDSKGNTLNTSITVPGEAPQPECTADAECPGGECVSGTCVPLPSGEKPVVLFVEPASGPAQGGTAVTVTGSNFAAGAQVRFGSASATQVVVVSSSSITCTTPAGAPGPVDVVVENPNGDEGSFAKGYSYVDSSAAPSLTALNPSSGSIKGGTTVSISGSGFKPGAIVTFGTESVAATVVSATQLSVVTPPAAAEGAVDVTVTNSDNQTDTLANAFTYQAEVPDWGSLVGSVVFSAIAGSATAPVTVEVYEPAVTDSPGQGSGLIVEVGFGPKGSQPQAGTWEWAPASYTGDSGNNDVYAAALSPSVAGSFDVAARASVDAGKSWLWIDANGTVDGYSPNNAASLTVTAAPTEPTVLSMAPIGGPLAGGTVVTLSGAQLGQATNVKVGGATVPATAGANGSKVTFTTPAQAAGSVEVVLVLAGGEEVEVPQQFRYGLVLSPTVNGGLGNNEWPSAYVLADNDTATTWGTGLNELGSLYAAFDANNLYIAVTGKSEANNAVVVYIDTDFGAGSGPAQMTTLSDNDGILDDALSGTLSVDVAGFGADFACGSVGMASFSQGSPLGGANAAGWRKLDPLNNFPWLDGNAIASGALEFSLPLSALFPSGVPKAGVEVGLVVRLGNQFGSAYSNQSLPDAVSGDSNTIQGAVAKLTVFPLQ